MASFNGGRGEPFGLDPKLVAAPTRVASVQRWAHSAKNVALELYRSLPLRRGNQFELATVLPRNGIAD